jgi:hypothetical protein
VFFYNTVFLSPKTLLHLSKQSCFNWGDHIRQFIAHWTIFYFVQIFEHPEVAKCFHGKRYALVLAKIGWATFWSFKNKTRLVTLALIVP